MGLKKWLLHKMSIIENVLKVLESNLNFLIFVEKFILYVKITVSPKKFVNKIRF